MRSISRRLVALTMVELLVVIAILATLAALIFPALSRVRESAARVSASSNLHQVGLAEILYQGDYDGRYVPYFSGLNAVTGQYTAPQRYWPQLVSVYALGRLGVGHGYLGQDIDTDLPSIFFDPAVPFRAQTQGDFGYICSWGLSDEIADWEGPVGYRPTKEPCSDSELAFPADTYLLVETRDYFRGAYPGDALALAPDSNYGGANASVSTAGHYFGSDDFSHVPATGRTLVFYADGHTRSPFASIVASGEKGWRRTSVDSWP